MIVNSHQGDYQKFLNHGFKSGQMSKELSKLKVDVLGKVLKKHVTQLRSGNQNEQEFILTNCKNAMSVELRVVE